MKTIIKMFKNHNFYIPAIILSVSLIITIPIFFFNHNEGNTIIITYNDSTIQILNHVYYIYEPNNGCVKIKLDSKSEVYCNISKIEEIK